MSKVSILLVDNRYFNITNTSSALKEASLDHSLYFAGSGKDGLDILMGDPFHELIAADNIKIKPNVVILSKELEDMPSLEFLAIVRKYYSLKDIKVFLLSDSLSDAERSSYEEIGLDGSLQRPLNVEQVVEQIQPKINSSQRLLTLLPFISLKAKATTFTSALKTKIISISIATKTAACIGTTLIVGTVAMYNMPNIKEENLTATAKKTQVKKNLSTDSLSSPLPIEKTVSINEQTVENKAMPMQGEIASEIRTSSITERDTLSQPEVKEENSVSAINPENLRIVVEEMQDSTAH